MEIGIFTMVAIIAVAGILVGAFQTLLKSRLGEEVAETLRQRREASDLGYESSELLASLDARMRALEDRVARLEADPSRARTAKLNAQGEELV